MVVPKVSYGNNGVTQDGRKKALGMDNEGSSGDDKFWIQTYFKETFCMGIYTFETDSCKTMLHRIVDNCNTDTNTPKLGDSIDDVCAEYRISGNKNPTDPNSFQLQNQVDERMGDWTCKDMPNAINSPSFANSCECYYSGQATVTDQFDKPSSGNCKDIKEGTVPKN